MDAALVTTTEWTVRQSVKVAMAALSLVGITGMYLHQVKKTGVLGLLGYLVFGAGYLVMLAVEFAGAYLLPSIAHSSPGYVNDVLALANNRPVTGDTGAMGIAISVMAITYLTGGLIFGVALFRAGVLARWACLLLAFGSVSTIAITVLPQVNERLFAVPTGLALIGLGCSLIRGLGLTQPSVAPSDAPVLLAG